MGKDQREEYSSDKSSRDSHQATGESTEERGRPSSMKQSARSVPLPEVNFSAFIVSLHTSALLHLGEIPDPATGDKHKDVGLARHTIDTVAMLQDKTQGNLTDEEKGLLEHLLFDLRLKFVKAKTG